MKAPIRRFARRARKGVGDLFYEGAEHSKESEAMTQTLTHHIGGAAVEGASGRFADIYNPGTGEVEKRVALASAAEVGEAISIAKQAQPGWAATNPQRRARVFMKFVDLLNRDMDALAEALSREHGKTVPDSRGDVQRGLEVCEFVIGAPHLLKGEFTEGAGPAIDMYSMRQPIGVGAGITPFNFPAMIPLWMAAPAIACGNAFILKPSERDPSVPLMLAELFLEAGCPRASSMWCRGTKRRSTPFSTIRMWARSASSAPRRSPSRSIPAPRRTASAPSASAAPRTT